MMRCLLFTLMIFGLSFSAMAQITVTGTITDDTGEALPAATVTLKGTTQGTVADIDGKYSLKVPNAEAVLVFSYVGYQNKEVVVGTQTVIDVQLSSDAVLEEVVVTGYRTYTKESSNISSVTVSAAKINKRPNPNILQTLSGQVAGANISATSGQPGATPNITIRGSGSVNGQTQPLYVVDGVPLDGNFRSINPNEIANVTILKDAGATAIYGNRGANGVIVITTKNGSYSSPLEVTYTAQYMSTELQGNDYNLMSASEQLAFEKANGAGRGAGMSDADIAAASTFDWSNFFFRNAKGINHNIQISKGGDNVTTFLSLGFLDQEGILRDSGLKRFNFRVNTTGRSENKKFNYALAASGNYSISDEPNSIGSGAINRNYVLGAYQSVPYISVADYTNGAALLSPLSFANTPLFLYDRLLTYTRLEKEIKTFASLSLGYEIIDGLRVESRTAIDFQQENLLRAEQSESFNALLFGGGANPNAGFQDQQNRQQFTYNQVTSIKYNKTFANKHTVSAGLYNELFHAQLNTFGFRENGLDSRTFYPGDGASFIADNSGNDFFVDAANATIRETSLLSYFGTADYDYNKQFGVGVTVRRDASSRFFGSEKWGTFYSVSGRVNLHQFQFMDNLDMFTVLKLRGSYGTNGNQDISGGGYFASPDLYRALFATGPGYTGANSIALSQIPNNLVKWENTAQANIGFDAELFDSRLRVVFDVYSKTTSDLFLNIPVSSVNAATTLAGNVGEMNNRGVELELHYDLLRSEDPDGLKLTLDFVGAINKEEIKALPGGVSELSTIGRVGGKLFEYFDYRYAGVNPANGELLFLTADGELTENPNPDTDRVWLGQDLTPEAQGSFGFNLDYKGFFLATQFNYIIGADRYDGDYQGFVNPGNIGQFRHSTDILRAWTTENRVTDIPAIGASNVGLTGTRFLRSADFLRLRFISLGYNVPQSILDKVGMRTAQVFFNAENLVTFSKWRGFDPEIFNNTSRQYPTPRFISLGLTVGI